MNIKGMSKNKKLKEVNSQIDEIVRDFEKFYLSYHGEELYNLKLMDFERRLRFLKEIKRKIEKNKKSRG